MNYCKIKDCDIADGPGVRVSLFVSGCRNRCPGCFQPETWDFNYGEPFTPDVEEYIMKILDLSYIFGLTILGGDPFEPENQIDLAPFITRVKTKYPQKTIWMYTGYTWEQLTREKSRVNLGTTTETILRTIDILVDGPFIEAEKDLRIRFRGSRNQRIIDVQQSLLSGGEIVQKYQEEEKR